MADAPKVPRLPRDSDFFKKLRERWKFANDSESQQCERELEDIAFEDGQQWPETIRLARQGQQPVNGMPAVPARPTLVIDKVKEPVRQILNQERQADIGIELTPAEDFGDLGITPDDEEITLREGLMRRIQRASHAADARTWAYKRAVISGRGYYIVRTRFLPGKTWDQEVYIDRIFNQEAVKLDPTHTMPDGSDADWEFMGTWMSCDRFEAEYGQDVDGKKWKSFAGMSDDEFMGLTEAYPEWYKQEGDNRSIRIVDYWETKYQPKMLGITGAGQTFWVGPSPEDVTPQEAAQYAPEGTVFIDTRRVIDKTIEFCKCAGGSITLEQTTESGPDMPIIKVLGDEVLPYDEQRRANGVIRPARDPQMALNYMTSKLVEQVGLTPISPVTVDPDAIDGYEDQWKLAATRALPFLPIRTYDDQGRELRAPARASFDPNLAPMANSIAMFDQMLKNATDASLANLAPSAKSGKAIDAVIQNAQLSSSHYLDNLARSMQYEGQVINNKLYPIYGIRPGRLVRILTGEGEEQQMQIGQDPAKQQMVQQAQKVAKLTKDAQFNVIVKVTRSAESRRTQENTALGELIQAEPSLMTWFGDLYLKTGDTPNRLQLADRAKAMLAPPIQQMIAAEQQGSAPPNPQVQQAQTQIQQLQQEVQQAKSGMAEKQLDSQTRLQIAQLDNETRFRIAAMQVQATIQATQQKIQASAAEASIEAETKRIAAVLDEKVGVAQMLHTSAHDAASQLSDQQHTTAGQLLEHAHESAMAAQSAVQQQQAAAQQPPASPQEPA